jgi:predicted ATPase/DNA-binding SARP family transcriptional activator/Tfp pilus assembly protein PilF
MTPSETPGIIPPALTLALFGPMQVRVQGRPLPHLRSRQSLWLLALLTLRHSRPVEREWLAGTLWPDSDQRRAFRNLRVVLSELRKALGAQSLRLQSPDRHTLSLDITGAEVDVHAFDTAVLSGKRAELAQAVTLYRGPLLEGCLEEWVSAEREAREQSCLRALQTLGDSALTAGDYDAAAGCYQRAVRMDPLSDAARRGWMEALSKNGDRNAALQVYWEFIELLHRDDPTATPDEPTSALYGQLRAEARRQAAAHAVVVNTPPRPSVAGYLPQPLTGLVGREDERNEVSARLRRSRLVTLMGPGGIGKTRLAMAVAAESGEEYADGVWLVALESLTEGSRVAQQIASVLGIKDESERPLLERVTDHLRKKRLLLLLDNCEHLLDASARIIAHLLRECAGLRILATSREAVGVTGETIWPVPALTVPGLEHLPEGPATLIRLLAGYESVQLFVERAQAANNVFALRESNARAVARLCFQLEGIPLAIELAAARVSVLSPIHILEQVQARRLDFLAAGANGRRDAASRQRSLRATLEWSYKLLPEAGRRFLAALSIFRGGWTAGAAQAVCGLSEGETVDLLALLRDSSMIRAADTEEGMRFSMLETIREYAAEQLEGSKEQSPISRRHRDFFLALAEEAEPHLTGANEAVWLERLENEHENLRVALVWSLCGKDADHPLRLSLRFCGALHQFWQTRGYLSEGREWCRRSLQADGEQERTAARANALHTAGALAWLQGDYDAARNYLNESLSIHQELGNQIGIARSLNNLGNVAYFQSDYFAARAFYEEGLPISRERGDRKGIASSLNNLGNVAYQQGDYPVARAYFEESVSIRRDTGDRQNLASTLNNLGCLTEDQGDYTAARAFYEESLAIRQEMDDAHGIATSLHNLGCLAESHGEYDAARAHCKESLAIRQKIGDRPGTAAVLNNLGTLAIHRGDYASARTFCEQSLAIKREIGDRRGIAYGLEAYAILFAAEAAAFTGRAETGLGGRRVARLCGAAQALRDELGAPLSPIERQELDLKVASARAKLGERAWAEQYTDGKSMSLEQVVACALGREIV